jgi:hypothetical protein
VQAPQPLEELIADKGYHSNQTMIDLDAVGIRSYVAEPDRVAAIGPRSPRLRPRFMPVVGGLVDRAVVA